MAVRKRKKAATRKKSVACGKTYSRKRKGARRAKKSLLDKILDF